MLVLQLILTVSPGPAAVVEGLWVTLICPLLSETQQEENQLKTWQYTWRNELISNLCSTNLEQRCESPDEDDDEGHVDEIVVCVSDEVLNSQHYKHSQSTEASDQYANTLQIIYLKTGAH